LSFYYYYLLFQTELEIPCAFCPLATMEELPLQVQFLQFVFYGV